MHLSFPPNLFLKLLVILFSSRMAPAFVFSWGSQRLETAAGGSLVPSPAPTTRNTAMFLLSWGCDMQISRAYEVRRGELWWQNTAAAAAAQLNNTVFIVLFYLETVLSNENYWETVTCRIHVGLQIKKSLVFLGRKNIYSLEIRCIKITINHSTACKRQCL